jgi:hypothetical protein
LLSFIRIFFVASIRNISMHMPGNILTIIMCP